MKCVCLSWRKACSIIEYYFPTRYEQYILELQGAVITYLKNLHMIELIYILHEMTAELIIPHASLTMPRQLEVGRE